MKDSSFSPDLQLMASGQWHNGFAPSIGEALGRTADIVFRLNSLPPSAVTERETLIRQLLGSIGSNFHLNGPFRCDFGHNISVGDNFVGNFNLTILDEAPVTIGNNVFIGPNTGIYTISHAINAAQRAEGVMRALPVTIGDDVWIGAGVSILPGVTVGSSTVIGAGSVVTSDIPPRVIAAGNPCRVIRAIGDDELVDVASVDDL